MLIDNNTNNKNNRFQHQQIVERRLSRCDTLPAITGDDQPQMPSLNINDQTNKALCKHVLVANHQQQQRPQTLPRKVNKSCDLLKSRCSFNEHHQQNPTSMMVAKTSSTTNMSDVIVGPLEQCSINATMTIRRLLQLYDSGEYREAANIIARLPYQTFRTVVLDLPVDAFVEAIPSSLPILDALYAKAFFSGRDLLAFGFKYLHPENVVSHMIKMFAICDVYAHSGSHESISICKKLLKVILIADPSLRKQLLIKKALIDRAVEGMGHHGLVGTSNDALMNLHEALKLEFERVIQQYKGAIAKIDELSLTTKTIKDGGPITRSLSQGPAPTFSSHQRLLSLKQEELQDRLNKNRSLLCALEPCFRTNHSLQILLAILQKRIDYDKETLFQFGQLSKEYSSSASAPSSSSSNGISTTPNPSHHHHHHRHPPSTTSTSSSSSSMAASVARQRSLLSNQFERDSVVAPVLMRFSHGCNQVLNLLKEIQHETITLTTTTTETDDQQQQQQQPPPPPMTAKCLSSCSASMSGTIDVSSPTDTMLESLDKMTKSANCCLSSSAVGGGNNLLSSSNGRNDPGNQEQNNNNCHQQQLQQQNNNITVTDDSSDISGYHSDSDMSPISTQSPLASNNRLLIIGNSITNQQPKIGATVQTQQQRSNVAIMTGQPDGTTLLAGEVTVNCGGGGGVGTNPLASSYNQQNMGKDSSHSSSSSCSAYFQQQKAYVVGNSICRIEIDGKPAAATVSTDVDNDHVIDDPDDDRNQSSLRRQLNKAQEMIEQLEREQLKLKEKLTIQSKQLLTFNTGSELKQFKFETLDQTHLSTNELIKHYEYLYSQVRVDVIDALDQFDELKDSNELKIKLLFSIVVLANRSTEQTFKEVFSRIGNLLQISNVSMKMMDINNVDNDANHHHGADDLNTIYEDINYQIGKYLRSTSAYFDLEPNVQNVCTQIWDTLYDFPCLIKCTPLIDFVRKSIRLCWHLHVQQNQYQMDIETKQFKNEWHCRWIGSDSTSIRIKSYVWPTLFQHGICVHKGVVVT